MAREAEKEHGRTALALVEEAVPDVAVDDNLAESVQSSSLEKLDEEISERADGITAELTDNELLEFGGILAERQANPKKKLLYESIADVVVLKADELRLRANIRPEGELARRPSGFFRKTFGFWLS